MKLQIKLEKEEIIYLLQVIDEHPPLGYAYRQTKQYRKKVEKIKNELTKQLDLREKEDTLNSIKTPSKTP